MRDYYKVTENGYVKGVGTNGSDAAIAVTEAEYSELLNVIRSAPSAPEGYAYRLRDDTLAWELAELSPAPEPSDEIDDGEAMTILMGGDA